MRCLKWHLGHGEELSKWPFCTFMTVSCSFLSLSRVKSSMLVAPFSRLKEAPSLFCCLPLPDLAQRSILIGLSRSWTHSPYQGLV